MAGGIAVSPVFQFFGDDGQPLAAGKVYTRLAGSSTPATTYEDNLLQTANTNPITLDEYGRCIIWGESTTAYKLEVYDTSSGSEVLIPNAGADNIMCFDANSLVTETQLNTALADYLPLEGGEVTGDVTFSGDVDISGDTNFTGNVSINGATLSPHGKAVFLSPGTYSFDVPPGITTIYVTGSGGGGGGSGAYTDAGASDGTGGSGANASFCEPVNVTGGSTISVVVGAGGAGGAANNPGSDGGDTVVGTLTINGGNGGVVASPNYAAPAGDWSSQSGLGNINSETQSVRMLGGGSMFATLAVSEGTGRKFGGGGSGGKSGGTTNGFAGGDGFAIIDY